MKLPGPVNNALNPKVKTVGNLNSKKTIDASSKVIAGNGKATNSSKVKPNRSTNKPTRLSR